MCIEHFWQNGTLNCGDQFSLRRELKRNLKFYSRRFYRFISFFFFVKLYYEVNEADEVRSHVNFMNLNFR